MILINHRINTVEDLKKIPEENGIEVDIRYHNNDLVLHHDPFFHHEKNPVKFEIFLKNWINKGPMILNVKCAGTEQHCIDLMSQFEIRKWFFLDLSMPKLKYLSDLVFKKHIRDLTSDNLSIRFSEVEPLEMIKFFRDKVKWVWVDCFSGTPTNLNSLQILKEEGFKICIVSPELQNYPVEHIREFKKQFEGFDINAVCTKYPDLWVKNI